MTELASSNRDLNAPQGDGLKLFAGATSKIGKAGDGDEFFAVGAHIALDPERGGLLFESVATLTSRSRQFVRSHGEVVADQPGAMLASNQLAQLLCILRFSCSRLSSDSGK
jgi:hypothetical protein